MQRKLKALFVLAILALSAFYLAVLFLAAHPKVSMAYRMYYLEMKTKFWNRNQTLAYIPGTPIDLVIERSFYLTRQGWSKPKEDGSGSEFSGDGGLYFTLHRAPGKLRFEGQLSTPVDNVELSLSVGSAWTHRLRFDKAGATSFSVELPSGLFVADPLTPNLISLHASHALLFQSLKLSHAQ